MDDIEQRISDDLETEISNELTKHEAGVLEEEIRIENESRRIQSDNIKNFEKSQKPKKSLKNKIIAWVLGASIFAGAVAGGVGIYNNNFSEEAKYNKEIKTKFEQVDETLTNRLNSDTRYGYFDSNKKIEYLRFNNEAGEDKILEVFYEGSQFNQGTQKSFDYEGYATFKILEDYYLSLVEAEDSNDVIGYLDALNQIFETMEYKNSEIYTKIDWFDQGMTESNAEKINEIFSLEIQDNNVQSQISFVPFNIELTDWKSNDDEQRVNYTYKMRGISYCKDNSGNVVTYYREILIDSSNHYLYVEPSHIGRLRGDILMIIDGIKDISEISVKTVEFQKTTIFENYNEMQEGNFNFAVPETFER